MDKYKFLEFLFPISSFLSDPILDFIINMISKQANRQKIKLLIKGSCDEAQTELDGYFSNDVFDRLYPIIEDAIKSNKVIDADNLLPDVDSNAKSYLLNKIRMDLIDTIDLSQFIVENQLTVEDLTREVLSLRLFVEKLEKEVNEMRGIRADNKICVLFLAANPDGTARLKLDEEARLITEMILKTKHRDTMIFESRWAIRTSDILQAINDTNPTIVHFSGHGSDLDELIVLDVNGNSKRISKEAIVQTMMTSSDTIRLVFFNTCFSHEQAKSVVNHVDYSIGMTASIGDDAARIFAAQFYSSIGFGKTIWTSFEQARAALMLEGIPEENTPALYSKSGIDPNNMALIS